MRVTAKKWARMLEDSERELQQIRIVGDAMRQARANLLWRQWIETGAV